MTGDSFTKNPIERRKYFWIYAEKKGRNVSVLPREYGQRYFEFLHEHGKFNGRWYGPEGTTRRRLPKIIEAPERGSLPSNARFFLLDPADEPIYRAAAPFGLAADWRKRPRRADTGGRRRRRTITADSTPASILISRFRER